MIDEKLLSKINFSCPVSRIQDPIRLADLWKYCKILGKGWIYDLYIKPKYFFSFYGFEFVKPLGEYTYILFAVCAVSALLVAVGLFYRVASILLFVSFTYIELMDKSTYLNHYYFISMISLMMIFLPAHAYFSLDAFRNKRLCADAIPRWSLDAVKLFVCFVYVFAGIAKINSDWLLEAQPLRMWLPAKNDLPIIGPVFNHVWVAYAFSWAGCLYDLSIPFLLLNKSTRYFCFYRGCCFPYVNCGTVSDWNVSVYNDRNCIDILFVGISRTYY